MTKPIDRATPLSLGYRMAAEWAPHTRTWLAWPHKVESWPGNFEPIPRLYTELARTLAEFEPVAICAAGAALEQARQLVGHLTGVTLFEVPTNDAWMRDHGPTFLVGPKGSQPALVDWGYNAWGGKYPPYELDDAVPAKLAALLGRRRFIPGIILEGGAIDPNGEGTILTTEECLLNPNRNPGLSKPDMERYLRDFLGARHILWLGRGIAGDDTDGHIDELARFVGPRTVVAALERDPGDENYEPLAENFRRLQAMQDQSGRPLEVIPLPMPEPLFFDGARLPASYANFYIANGVVIVPQFAVATDREAVEILAKVFPTRQIRPLPARELAWGLGAFHCITQQEPAL